MSNIKDANSDPLRAYYQKVLDATDPHSDGGEQVTSKEMGGIATQLQSLTKDLRPQAAADTREYLADKISKSTADKLTRTASQSPVRASNRLAQEAYIHAAAGLAGEGPAYETANRARALQIGLITAIMGQSAATGRNEGARKTLAKLINSLTDPTTLTVVESVWPHLLNDAGQFDVQKVDDLAETLTSAELTVGAQAKQAYGKVAQELLTGGAGATQNIADASGLGATDEVQQKRLKQDMLRYLDGLEYNFGVQYAPAEFKAKMHHWNLDAQFQAARDKVQKASKISVEDFQPIVRDIILSCRDYHVSMYVDSDERATLPFTVQAVGEGKDRKYFVVSVDEKAAGKTGLPFGPGAQVVELDGKPVADAIEDLRPQVSFGTGPTDYALTAADLTARSAEKAMQVPKGPVSLTVIDEAGHKKVCHLEWDYTPEKHPTPAAFGGNGKADSVMPLHKIISGNKRKVLKTKRDAKRDSILESSMDNMSCMSRKELEAKRSDDPFSLAARRSFVPRLGKVIAEGHAKFPFDWYVYENAQGKMIGYIRIPDYMPDDTKESVTVFAGLMNAMQKNTDALVIDQVNNPGGSVLYLAALASCLTDRPLETPKHHMAITQKSVQQAEEIEKISKEILASPNPEKLAKKLLGPSVEGYPVTKEFIKSNLSFAKNILREFDAGHQVTAPSNLEGVDDIEPYPEKRCRYTKPIVFLTNERCFSGGDFMPAILQDNKRATIFGARTAGAGGFVNQISTENLLGIDSIHVTGSLAERATGGGPIEEYGVTPDVPYAITENDIHAKFAPYAEAVNAAVDTALHGKPGATEKSSPGRK